jgi:hypothetical protein
VHELARLEIDPIGISLAAFEFPLDGLPKLEIGQGSRAGLGLIGPRRTFLPLLRSNRCRRRDQGKAQRQEHSNIVWRLIAHASSSALNLLGGPSDRFHLVGLYR